MEESLSELISSLQASIDDIHEHPTKIDDIPSDFEILANGVRSAGGIEMLFSPKIDSLIAMLFKMIDTNNFDKILEKKDSLEQIISTIFGDGSFKGPVSTAILNNIAVTTQSKKYIEMKSYLGKTVLKMKKINMILKNLQRNSVYLKGHPDEYEKYKTAVYAIKKVLKFVSRIYRNRKLINRKVYYGLNNIVHEDYEEILLG